MFGSHVQLLLSVALPMATVGENHKCPLCGRIGNGSYAIGKWNWQLVVMDGVDVGPICTGVNNRYSCLSRVIDGATPNDIVGSALEKVLGNDFNKAYPGVAMLVAAWAGHCHMQHLDDRSAEQPVDGDESFTEICIAARPVPNLWNAKGMNDQLTYERRVLMYWALSRPVARIHLATVQQRRFCRSLRAAWTLWRMQALNRYDMLGCRGCGAFPTEATCAQCNTKWCGSCSQWSASCWKCYRPRLGLSDCGEFVLGLGGPAGNGGLDPAARALI